MFQLLSFISWLLNLYIYVLIASAVFSWLYAFNVINTGNDLVRSIGQVLHQITEPVLRPVRSVLPNFGGIDLSPIVVILGIFFIQSVILPNIANLVT